MSSSESTSPPRNRRRSSLVPRKSVVFAAPPLQSDEAALKQYIAQANSEKQKWVSLAKERRAQSKEIEKTLMNVTEDPPTLSFEDVKEYLTDDDLMFLSQRPDYEKLVADVDTLVEEVAIIKDKLQKRSSHIELNGFLAQARLDTISNALCNYNEREPLWMPTTKS